MKAKQNRLASLFFVLIIFLIGGCTENIQKLWEFPTDAPIYSTPVITKNLVVFGNEAGNVYAVHKKDGAHRWRFNAFREVFATPLVYKDKIYVGSTNYMFYCLDMSGREQWKYSTKARIKSDATANDGVIYFSSYDKHVFALNAETKELIWKFPPDPIDPEEAAADKDKKAEEPPKQEGIKLDWEVGEFSYSSPVYHEGVIFVGNLDSRMYALNAKDGTIKWIFKTGDSVTSTPNFLKGMLYFGSSDKNIYALDVKTGKQKWVFKTNGAIYAEPKIKDGVIYVGSWDKHFYAIDINNGKKKWSYKTLGPIISSSGFYKNLVLFGGGKDDQHIYALDNGGEEFWKFKTGYKIDSDPIIDGDKFYVTSGDRKLYAFKINNTIKK